MKLFRTRYIFRTLGAVMALLCASTVQVDAQDSEAGVRLERIRIEVATTETLLATLKNDFAKLKREERSLEGAIVRLDIEDKALVNRVAELSRQREELALKVRAAEQKVEQQRALIRQRLRVLYMNTAVSSKVLFHEATAMSDRERLAAYARAVRGYDEKQFDAVKRAVSELVDARKSLEVSLEETQRVQGELKAKRAESEKQKLQLQTVVKEIQAKQQRARESLALLTSEARKLEQVVQSMTGGLASGESPREPAIATPQPKPSQTERSEQDQAGKGAVEISLREVLSPDGLFGKQVRVVYPVKGDVLQRFGKTRVAEFSDMIFSKGLEYKTPEGSQVRAVLGGQVAFAGVMPGYDTVVILDHGARSYSLYGRLGKSFVEKGQILRQSDVVGVTSSADSKGRNFYFETRKNGAPVDPSTVLNKGRG